MAKRGTRATRVVEEDSHMSDNESSGGDEGEGLFTVEKILSHSTERNGRNKYLIKWEGYPDSENTWEDEDNIIDKDMLKKYWNEKNAEKAAQASAKKAAQAGAKKAATRAWQGGDFEELGEEVLQAEDWEPLVKDIQTVDRHPDDNMLYVVIKWKDGKTTSHPASDVYKRCPQRMLQFYEGRLRFRNS